MKYSLAAFSLIAFLIQHLAASERPNIVMIFTDDQRYDAVGYAGNDVVFTPNLDRLAKQGLIFQNCFVNTSICAISARGCCDLLLASFWFRVIGNSR